MQSGAHGDLAGVQQPSFPDPPDGSPRRLRGHVVALGSGVTGHVGAESAARPDFPLKEFEEKSRAGVEVVHIELVSFAQEGDVQQSHDRVIARPLPGGVGFFTGVHEEVQGVAARRVRQDKKLETPFGRLVFDVLLEPDPRFARHHPLVDGDVLVGVEESVAGLQNLPVQRLDLAKPVVSRRHSLQCVGGFDRRIVHV